MQLDCSLYSGGLFVQVDGAKVFCASHHEMDWWNMHERKQYSSPLNYRPGMMMCSKGLYGFSILSAVHTACTSHVPPLRCILLYGSVGGVQLMQALARSLFQRIGCTRTYCKAFARVPKSLEFRTNLDLLHKN